MKRSAKSKVVTSGRLTGRVKAPLSRRRVTPGPDPGPACPEAAYSLYSTSTDPEDQVCSLHQGLDRCAALLTDILQTEQAGPPRAVKEVAARPIPRSALGKKTIRNTKTNQRGRRPVQPVPGTKTPAVQLHPPENQTSIHPPENQTSIHPPENQTSIHPPENQTSIHPPENQTSIHPPKNLTSIHPPENQTSIHPPQTSIHPPYSSIRAPQTSIHPPHSSIHPPQTSIHPPQTSIHPTQTSIHPPQTSIHPPQTSIHPPHEQCDADGEEEESVPVRDMEDRSSAVRRSCPLKMSNMQLQLGQVDKVLQDSHNRGDCSAEKDVDVKTVQHLLGELKALIAGQGSEAERLLSRLQQAVSSPLMGAGSSIMRTGPGLLSLHSQNTRLQRRVRTLNQQLKQSGTADPHQNLELLRYSQVVTLQEELSTAQSQLQEVQQDLAELRKALEDTQNRLTNTEAEHALIQADLVATRSRLLDSEREKSELSALAQQRLEDLNRVLQGQGSSKRPGGVDGSVSGPAGPPTDRIAQFLMSLGQLQPAPTEPECVAAERQQQTPRDTGAHPHVTPGGPVAHLDPSDRLQEVPSRVEWRRRLSRGDVESVRSEWSARSGSTFDTRDEAAFRDGLAALDASIASLQRTMHLDLGRL